MNNPEKSIELGYNFLGYFIPKENFPAIFVGENAKLAYISNAKSACTTFKHILFYANKGYEYNSIEGIHYSELALHRTAGSDLSLERAMSSINRLAPEIFSAIRKPEQRIMSSFFDKIWNRTDPHYSWHRDFIHCSVGIDLSSTQNPLKVFDSFVAWLSSEDCLLRRDPHFRTQYRNLALDSGLELENIFVLEKPEPILNFLEKFVDRGKLGEFFDRKLNASAGARFGVDDLQETTRKALRDYLNEDLQLYQTLSAKW